MSFLRLALCMGLVGIANLLSSNPAQAQLLWNTNGTGGSGSWDTQTANWYDGFSNVVWDSNTAVFAGTAGTVSLNAGLNATGLTFNTSGYTLAGIGSLTFTNSTPTILNPATSGSQTHIINVPLSATNRVVFSSPSAGTSSVTFNLRAANTFSGGLLLSGPNIRLNFNSATASGTGAGSGTISVDTPLTRISNVGSAAPIAVTIPNNIVLNSNNLAGPFLTAMGATSPTSTPTSVATQSFLRYTGIISGNSDVIISNSATGSGGAGATVFANSMTYTGRTILNMNASSGVLQLGVTNALPTSTALVFGSGVAAFSVGLVDLNGFDQRIGSLVTNLGTGATALGVTNSGAAVRTLTIAGTGTNTYASVIGAVNNSTWFNGGTNPGGTNNIAVTLDAANTGTQIFTGNNTYSGGTIVNGGTLLANGQTGANSGTGSGTVSVGGTGTFGGTGQATGSVSIASGGMIRGGDTSGIGTLTINGGLSTAADATIAVRITGGNSSASNGGSTTGTVPNPTSNNFFDVTAGTLTIDSGTIFRIDGTGTAFTLNSPYSFQIGRRAGQSMSGLLITNQAQFSTVGFQAEAFSVTGDASGAVYLSFTPVPEPTTIVGLSVALLTVSVVLRRHRFTESQSFSPAP